MGQGAVGDQQAAHAAFAQMLGRQFDGFAGTDQQHRGFVEPGKRVLCQSHRRGCDRHWICADTGVGTRTLGHRKGLLEQPVQPAAQRAVRPRHCPGVLHLAQNLGFSQYHRIQPGGDTKQVTHRLGFLVLVQITAQAGRVGFQPVDQAVRLLGHRIQLGTVAGGQQRGLAHLGQRTQRFERAR